MSEDLVRRPASAPSLPAAMSTEEFDQTWRMARALAASGMFKDVTQAEQAFGRILLGRDLGLTPTQALMSVDVVRGNVQVRSIRLAAWVKQHPDYDYRVVEHDDLHCLIEFYGVGHNPSNPREMVPLGYSSFSIEDAKKAGIWNANGPWKAHPRNMVWARAMSNGVKWYCPDLTGGIPVYTEADSFDAVATATELGTGDGDGSEPGWGDMDPALVEKVEAIIARAQATGFSGFSDRATLQMLLAGRTPEAVESWLLESEAQLQAVGGTDG